jgi:hypothetical protein
MEQFNNSQSNMERFKNMIARIAEKKAKEIFWPSTTEELETLISIAVESKWVELNEFSHGIIMSDLELLEKTFNYDEDKIKLVIQTFNLSKRGW